jgi:hypothetical protein
MFTTRSFVLAVAGTVLTSSCTGGATTTAQSSGPISTRQSSVPVTPRPAGLAVTSFSPQPGCHPVRPPLPPAPNGLVEVRGIARAGQLWALVFDRVPLPIVRKVKIAWRMTGVGSLRLLALGKHEQVVRPYDLIRHGGSSWHRPGDEWGAFFVLPSAGCWDLRARRGSLTGDVWLAAR